MGDSFRIIAIDTSSRSVSVAVLDGEKVLFELDSQDFLKQIPRDEVGESLSAGNAGSGDKLPFGYVKKRSKRGSKTSRVFAPGASILLAPMIQKVLRESEMKIQDFELVAISVGPGMFTGLRVGVVTAKSLAYSIGADLIGVNTLEVIAGQTACTLGLEPNGIPEDCVIKPVLNAQRKQLFSGSFKFDATQPFDWKLNQLAPDEILARNEWIENLRPADVVCGPGLEPILDQLKMDQPEVTVAPKEDWDCSATSVGRLAYSQYKAGKRDDLWKLEPVYFRPSAAEEVRSSKLKNTMPQ
ncbi:MAG: tRNA (adenosine(37)-N6)-threonylcarbamoyltransferase complex dimerization subunit type 1 TsaB [Mariniblastus sp.]